MASKVDIIQNFVKAYRSLTAVPEINYGQIIERKSNPDLIKVTSGWSQRNVEQGKVVSFRKTFVIKAQSPDVIFESTPSDTTAEEITKISHSDKFFCVVRKTKPQTTKRQFIEIWTQKGLLKNFDVSAFDIHGEIYFDDEFGSLGWSHDEEKIVYLAEKKAKKPAPFYQQKSESADTQDNEKAAAVGEDFIYKPDWGEQLVGRHQPVVAICDIKAEQLKLLEGIPPNFSPAKVFWSKDGKGIFGIVFENEPRRLGLIYCTNRPSYIFSLTLNGEFKILSEANKSVRSPRLSPDGKALYWLQRPTGGVHDGCKELVKLDLATNKREVLINIVRTVGKTFSGLFVHNLPARCFSKDGTKLFFSSLNKLKICAYYLDLGTKQVNLIETGDGSSVILDVHDDMILISSGSLQRSPSLKLSKSISKIEWIPVTKSEEICPNSVLKEMEFESKTGNHKFTYYNALYYGPPAPSASGQKVPLIVWPHGGPHGATINNYTFEHNFFVKIGYGVLLVNYRGSVGAGQDGVDFLQGKIGDTDVKDNHEAAQNVLKNIPYLDGKNVFLNGKSHGGFLVGNLSAQYPDFYRAVASGNPVTDVYSMYVMSDIPDWATSESGFVFDESKPLTLEQINKMMVASPIQLADKIKAPTLLILGKNDLRVPYYEGVKMYNALKAKKVKVRLNVYDDNHTLARGAPNHMDHVINTALWFTENKA